MILKLDFSSKLGNSWKLETHYIDLGQIELQINCPKAINGQRYPCPAHQHSNGSFKVGRAVDPEGTMSCRIHRESVRTSVHLVICQSVHPPRALQWLAGWMGGTYIWTDRRTYPQIPPEFYGTSSPLGPLPKKWIELSQCLILFSCG